MEFRRLEIHELYCHPAFGAKDVHGLVCKLRRIRSDLLELTYEVDARGDSLSLPAGHGARRDGLWKSTCFEIFFGSSDGPAYRELNFSPGGDWAAYGFTGYRKGQHDLTMHSAPAVLVERKHGKLTANIRVSLDDLEDGDPIGISAVIEEKAGFGLSYWSINHAMPNPDFHLASCFTGTLPAPENP